MSVQRRLSARRGSTTAPDPFGVHADLNLNPNRSTSSRLTIVRVPAAPAAPAAANPTPLSLNDPPSSPVLGQRRLHRRVAPPAAAPERVSFAFSSFDRSASGRDSPDHALSSPSSSPRLRPSSPHLSASNPYGTKPRLTPDQLVSLARHSTIPRANNDPVSPPAATAPATFTPLPDDIYLPFIDRPSEVSALISSPPDLKLFSLLAQTYRNKLPDSPSVQSEENVHLPPDPANWTYAHLLFHLTRVDRDIAPDFIWAIAARKSILSHSELLWERIKGALGIPPELDVDYNFLEEDQESPDTSDISDDEGRAARGHWSDWDDVIDSPVHARKRLSMGDSPANSTYSSSKKEDQFKAQVDDKLAGLQGGFTRSSLTVPDETEAGNTTTISPTPHGLPSPPHHDHDVEGIVIGHFSPPIFAENPDLIPVSIEPLLAPPTGASPGLLFNSLSGSTVPGASAALPVPGEGALGLGDIAEGAEEEEEEEGVETETTVVEQAQDQAIHDPDLISPSQIQGLRISTSPLPTTGSSPLPHTLTMTPPVLSPVSPLPSYPNISSTATGNQVQAVPIPTNTNAATTQSHSSSSSSQPHSRRSSFGSLGPFQRSESTGNLSASWSAIAAAAAAATSGGGIYGANNANPTGTHGQANVNTNYASSIIGSDAGDSSTGYISDGDVRSAYGGGQPLFVSNFARLAGGPTLRANTSSSKRHSGHVPHVRYAVDSLALHMRNSSTGSAASNLGGVQPKVRTYSQGAGTRPKSVGGSIGGGGGGGASLGRVASLGGSGPRGSGGGGGGGILSSSSSSSLSSLGGGNRKSWGETKE